MLIGELEAIFLFPVNFSLALLGSHFIHCSMSVLIELFASVRHFSFMRHL